jgi:hypothetical protein
MLPTEQSVARKETRAGCRAEFFTAGVSVERNIGTATGALRAKGAPVDRGIENVGAVGGCPFEPSMRLAAGPKAFPDHESDIIGAARMHRVVKCNGFALAIGIGTKLDLFGSFPFHRKPVRDRTQVSDPMVDDRYREVLLLVAGSGAKDRSNSGHLSIIGGRINGDVVGLGESGETGETENGQPDETDFSRCIRVDAYCNHINYNFYKHGLCHGPGRKVALGNAAESGRLGNRVSSVKSKPVSYETLFRVAAWTLFAAILTAVVWARIRLAGLPLERDEGEYAYGGQLLLHGIPPYRLAYSMKFPGTCVAYALLMSIFGSSSKGIHFGLVLINLVSAGLIFFLGRNLLGEVAGIAAAAAYSVLSLMPYVLGPAAHATHFVVLFAVAGALPLTRSLGRQSKALIFASGCLFGFALLMKQPGLLFIVFGTVYLFSRDWRAQLNIQNIVFRNLLFLSGAAVPLLVAFVALWNAGVFGKFWFWTINYASQYGRQVPIWEGFQIFVDHFWTALGTAWPIWAVAAIGFVVCIVSPTLRVRAAFLLTFAFFSALAVCPGFYFRPHYFILLLPAIALLAGAAVFAAIDTLHIGAHKLRLFVIMLFALCLAWPLYSEADFFFGRPLLEANRMINGTNPFPESVKIGEYIRAQSTPSDTIAVLGSEPQIYFYSKRHSATGYIYTYGLMEPQPYAHQMQQEMIREIEAARPKFLVLVVVNKSWLAGADSDQSIFRWADAYCDANYEEVGLVNISDRGSDYYFSGRPANVTPTADHILIYRRKV